MKMVPIALLFLAGLQTAVNESSELLEGKYDPSLPLLHKTGMVSLLVAAPLKFRGFVFVEEEGGRKIAQN